MGSAAIDLCFVAAGRLDVYFERGLNSWDCAAGELIAREAGAITSDFAGGAARPAEMLAAAPGIHAGAHSRCSTARVITFLPAISGIMWGVGTRILAVEDDERIRSAVKLALEDEGWTVDEAESGEQAIELFDRVRPTSC